MVNLLDLPSEFLELIKFPRKFYSGAIKIERDIYSNSLVITNSGYIPDNIREMLRYSICLQLNPISDYQVGQTWTGINWTHGPNTFPITNNETLRFVLPNINDSNKKLHENHNNILKKTIRMINDFSPDILIKYDKKEDLHNIYYVKYDKYNFNVLCKSLV